MGAGHVRWDEVECITTVQVHFVITLHRWGEPGATGTLLLAHISRRPSQPLLPVRKLRHR